MMTDYCKTGGIRDIGVRYRGGTDSVKMVQLGMLSSGQAGICLESDLTAQKCGF
jgi:hypothetical protein